MRGAYGRLLAEKKHGMKSQRCRQSLDGRGELVLRVGMTGWGNGIPTLNGFMIYVLFLPTLPGVRPRSSRPTNKYVLPEQ